MDTMGQSFELKQQQKTLFHKTCLKTDTAVLFVLVTKKLLISKANKLFLTCSYSILSSFFLFFLVPV